MKEQKAFKKLTIENTLFLTITTVTQNSKLLSCKIKVRLYKILARSVLLYTCEAWASKKAEEKWLITFERIILKRIFGTKKNTENNEHEQTTNA